MNSTLDTVRGTLAGVVAEINKMHDTINARPDGKMLASEARAYELLEERHVTLKQRVRQLEEEEARRQASDAARLQLGLVDEPVVQTPATVAGKDLVYGRGSGNSYFADLITSALPGGSTEGFEAVQRLQSHAEMIDRMPLRDIPEQFRATLTRGAPGGMQQRVNPNRTPGQGGYFVPPVWLIDDYVAFLRAGRTAADLFQKMDLPSGTDSINLPKLATGTATGMQTDNNAVTSQDITDEYVTAPVRTIAGQQDIALQLLEQSPVGAGFDQVMLKDLLSSYNQQLDIQCLTGSGTSPYLKGLANISGTNAVTYTDATPTLPKMYPSLLQALSAVARQRFEPATAIIVTPQRWYWMCSALDSQSRPLVLPSANGGSAVNVLAVEDAGAVEGRVGSFAGVPIYVDANIPTNGGAGTNQDTIWVGKFDDLYLYESALRTRVMVEVLSGTLQVRVQAYGYVAALVDRYPQSISSVTGTGTISPAGY